MSQAPGKQWTLTYLDPILYHLETNFFPKNFEFFFLFTSCYYFLFISVDPTGPFALLVLLSLSGCKLMFQIWGEQFKEIPTHCSVGSVERPYLARGKIRGLESRHFDFLRSNNIHLKILAWFHKNSSCSFKLGYSSFLGCAEAGNSVIVYLVWHNCEDELPSTLK